MSGSTQTPGSAGSPPPATKNGGRWWRAVVPFAIAIIIALLPAPAGLQQFSWYYFAIFVGVIAALVLEPLPNPAVGVIGISLVAALAPWVLESPAELAKPGFNRVGEAAKWALGGFSSTTVWLIGAAFMFATGYEKSGLGRRIALTLVKKLGKHTLSLGYANVAIEALLAIVTPSNSARGAGAVFPIVSQLPPIYKSMPNDPSRRLIGSYVMYTAFVANTITSTLFVTGCAPNFLALEFARRLAKVDVSWTQWFLAAAPFALPLLLLMPIIVYLIYPPQQKRSPEVSVWAAEQLHEMGPFSRRELKLSIIVACAVLLWIAGDKWLDSSMVAFLAMSAMLVTGVLTWNDMAKNHAAWTCVMLLATMVTMATGLAKVGFVTWFAKFSAAHLGGMDPTMTMMALITVYFVSHYFFASLTAHTSAMFPVMLGVGLGLPGLPVDKLVLGLALTTGIMGVISPYATGPALPYYNCGYMKPAEFWGMGLLFGALFLAALLFIGLPVMMMY